jgi:hypothetical protein
LETFLHHRTFSTSLAQQRSTQPLELNHFCQQLGIATIQLALQCIFKLVCRQVGK